MLKAGSGEQWAERALKCGFPERFAQQALGHNSKAVHAAQPDGRDFQWLQNF
jgi:hypothetical protein